jgi:hypothetical protein
VTPRTYGFLANKWIDGGELSARQLCQRQDRLRELRGTGHWTEAERYEGYQGLV